MFSLNIQLYLYTVFIQIDTHALNRLSPPPSSSSWQTKRVKSIFVSNRHVSMMNSPYFIFAIILFFDDEFEGRI